jgi:hypothetical protein
MNPKDYIKNLNKVKGIRRDNYLKGDNRKLNTQTILSRKDKETDPKKQRKNKSWMKEYA